MAKDLDRDYESAGFKGRLGFGDTPALVVVDFVNAYLDRESPLYAGVESALASAHRVLEAARRDNIPVIYTKVVYKPGGIDGGLFYKKIAALRVFDEGSDLGSLPSELEPGPDDVIITKQYASAFFGTSLSSTLNALGIDTVLIIGLSTSGCVRATAVDALQHGFIPVVVRDAVGDRDERVHEANLFDMEAKYADVVSEDELLTWMSQRSTQVSATG